MSIRGGWLHPPASLLQSLAEHRLEAPRKPQEQWGRLVTLPVRDRWTDSASSAVTVDNSSPLSEPQLSLL